MKEHSVDVLIVGAGTAGLNARRAVVRQGRSALMVDPGPLGTTCARVGCMPSKLLIAAADAAHEARHAGAFGVHTESVRVEGREVLDRVQRERNRFTGFVLESTDELEAEGILLRGRGRFTGRHTLEVDDQKGSGTRITFESAVLATGSSSWTPPPFRGLGDVTLTNEDVFELEDLPESLLVVGTGVIGLELGQAFHRLGVRTTLVSIGGLVGPISDPVVLAEATRIFGQELDFNPDYHLESVERTKEGVRIRFDGRDETYQRVLMAAGRRPNTVGIGLEHFGADEKKPLDVHPETGQLGDTNLFAAGDVTNYRPLLHEASDEGRHAGHNAAVWPDVTRHERRVPLAVVFSAPQIAMVGKRHADLDPETTATGTIDYGHQGRARVMNQGKGFVHIYGEKGTGRLLGAEMLGPRVEHTAHLLAWAIGAGLDVHQALRMPFYHPVLEEGLRTALRELRANL